MRKPDAAPARGRVSPDGDSVLDADRFIRFHGNPMPRRPASKKSRSSSKDGRDRVRAPVNGSSPQAASRERRSEGDAKPTLTAVPLSQVQDEETSYLVDPYLPAGAFCLLEGDPGVGKSYVAAAIGAAVTRGRVPDLGVQAVGRVSGPRRVLYVTAEDKQSTLRARFAGQGANLDLVLVVSETVTLKDLDGLARLVETHAPALVVIDPIHALFEGVSMTSANAVRVALTPLLRLAAAHGVSLIAIRHLAKAGRGKALYRGIGSIDFSAAARSVLRVGEDPSGIGSKVLVHVKNSLGPLGPSLEFEIEDRLEWLGRSELTAQNLDARPPANRGRSALELAQAFIEEQLKAGPRPANEVRAAASKARIAERTLERAQKALGVAHVRLNGGGRGQGKWLWSIASAHARDSLEAVEAETP